MLFYCYFFIYIFWFCFSFSFGNYLKKNWFGFDLVLVLVWWSWSCMLSFSPEFHKTNVGWPFCSLLRLAQVGFYNTIRWHFICSRKVTSQELVQLVLLKQHLQGGAVDPWSCLKKYIL